MNNMAKLNKMYYYTSTGEKKLNCYTMAIPKQVVDDTKLDGIDIKVKAEGNKIIIEKK